MRLSPLQPRVGVAEKGPVPALGGLLLVCEEVGIVGHVIEGLKHGGAAVSLCELLGEIRIRLVEQGIHFLGKDLNALLEWELGLASHAGCIGVELEGVDEGKVFMALRSTFV